MYVNAPLAGRLGVIDFGSARLDAIPWRTDIGGPNPGNSAQRILAATYLREQGQRNPAGELRWWNRINSTPGDQWGGLYTGAFLSEVKGEAAQGADKRAQNPASTQYGAAVLDPAIPMPAATATNGNGSLTGDITPLQWALIIGGLALAFGGKSFSVGGR